MRPTHLLPGRDVRSVNRAQSRKSLEMRADQESQVPSGLGAVHVDRRLLAVLSLGVAAIAIAHQAGDAHFDFGVFYYAAHMVFEGARHALYDLPTQRAFQSQFHRPPELLFCYPPFVVIPFLCVARLPIEVAFIIWTAASLVLFTWSVRTLANSAGLRYGNWPVLVSLAFMPIASSLGHGQLSIFVLSAYVLTYLLWRQGRPFLGGLVLSIAEFKFQLVVGFVGVLLLKRKWRELLGFGTGTAVFVSLSILVSGVPELLRYPAFLLQGNGDIGSDLHKMACWRGLLSLVGADNAPLVAVLSVLTIIFAARLWRTLDTGFSAAILATILVSYHLSPEDLSLLLISGFLSMRVGLPKQQLLPFALSALLIPEIVAIFGGYYALLAIPVVLCLWWIAKFAESQVEVVTASVTQSSPRGVP